MKFNSSNPTTDYRKNLVLHALLKIDEWKTLTRAISWPLHQEIKNMFSDNDKLAEIVNSTAAYYLDHEPLVPLIMVEFVIDELAKHPISHHEILQVMNSKIGDTLRLQP
ncbi:hypothetical protein [Pseudomonas sp. EMN2]|uniref:hypothetical protein n=1 Tax=Pseudomonas sp. EMN2 TaxID=2615212 RepID=UPI00129A9C77|nr:hypothetical protein [Pseudomonas sp. EMN2]